MRHRLFAVALILCVCFTGCAKKTAPASDSLVFMVRATADQLKVWQEAVDLFTEQSKIKVTLQNEPYDTYFSKLQTMIAGGTPPDVVFMESTRFPEFVTKNTLLNLTPYLQKETEFTGTDFYPEAWQSYRYQGQQYGLPNDIAVLGLMYNQDLFEIDFVKAPTTNWTWDDYLKAAQTLTKDTDEDGRIDQWGTTVCPWWQVFVWQNGGELVDNVQQPTRSTLSTPAAQGALQFLADLSLKQKVAPSASLTESMGRCEAFTAGKVAMIYAGHWDCPQLNKMKDSRWEAAPLPRGKQQANLGLGSGYCITSGSKRADDAWQFLLFMSAGEGQKKLLSAGFSTPANEALANSEYFAGGMSAGPGAFLQGLKFIHPVPFTTRYTEIATIWDQELQLLWSGQATVQQVTAKIDERVNKVLSEASPATAWLLPLAPGG
ncbi:MAG: sugar ABC transporter substrate-binding protein [Armatimonadia bacterium]